MSHSKNESTLHRLETLRGKMGDDPITLDEFAALIASELQLSNEEKAELTRRTELMGFASEPVWNVGPGPVVYYADTEFRKMRNISREEAAAYIAEASEMIGMTTKMSSLEMVQTLADYSDAALIAPWARPAIAAAVRSEWITCGGRYEVRPKSYLTPVEAISIVKRFADDATS